MKQKLTLWLCGNKPGRIAIHLYAIMLSGHVAWHWAGIVREFR